ncbi:MAG TPA: hypothetical protein VK988_04980 [Acidimicrobiales bacterium]|nr:hypothetical protein [Acidimicrobiales bacterium]
MGARHRAPWGTSARRTRFAKFVNVPELLTLFGKDLWIDTGRGETGSVRRYRIFRRAIPR